MAQVGGCGDDGEPRRDGEAFDPATGRWSLLPDQMAVDRAQHSLVAVAGGMIAIGGVGEAAPAELFDEESGRWIGLPCPLATPRDAGARVVAVPASALPAPAGR